MSSDDEQDPDVNVIPVDAFASDGDPSTWPGDPYAERDDRNWRSLLAKNWLEHMGSYEEGTTNTLDKLPYGYCLFDKPHTTNPRIRHPYLYGHPSGKYFQSQATFFEHFISLAQGTQDQCKCKNCQSMTGPKPTRTAGTSVTRPAQYEQALVDEEGPDYWKMLVMKLKEKRVIDEPIEQPKNIDWVLTHEDLSDYFTKLVIDPAYVPRRGELVLWIWSGLEDGSLAHNPASGMIEIRGNDNKWHGAPVWRAGVVTQVPDDEVHMVDIIDTPDSPRGLSYSGFRVETLPDPLSSDKSFSRQYSYVPLRNIKPFNSWQNYLGGHSRENVHPSIENALTVMSSFSMVSKVHAKGDWTTGLHISCKGIFVGAELLAVHDTVRIKPQGHKYKVFKGEGSSGLTDVMVIESITLTLTGCIGDLEDEQLAKHYTALITGKMFTTNPERGKWGGPFAQIDPQPLSTEEATAAFRQVGMADYGPWYRMANGQTCNVTPHHVIGRCYEPLAAQLMFGTHTFGYDLFSVMEGRNFSRHVDKRMPNGGTWFWGDSRVETLGLTEVNGVECGSSASQRETPGKWQAIMKVADGETKAGVRLAAGIPSSRGRPAGSKNQSSQSQSNKQFAGVASTSTLVSSALGGDEDDDSQDEDSAMTDENGVSEMNGLELSQVVIPSDPEDEDYV